jgi:hypothetical protein
MPQAYVDKGDPYREQCVATTEALRKRMGLDASKLMLTFQSRFGFDDRGKTRLSMKVVDQATGEDLEAKQKADAPREAAGE